MFDEKKNLSIIKIICYRNKIIFAFDMMAVGDACNLAVYEFDLSFVFFLSSF